MNGQHHHDTKTAVEANRPRVAEGQDHHAAPAADGFARQIGTVPTPEIESHVDHAAMEHGSGVIMVG